VLNFTSKKDLHNVSITKIHSL